MVNKRGQSLAEFMLVMGLLVAVGLFITKLMNSSDGAAGAIDIVAVNASNKIQADKD